MAIDIGWPTQGSNLGRQVIYIGQSWELRTLRQTLAR